MTRKITTIIIALLLLLAPYSVQSCKNAETQKQTCCCCGNSSESLQINVNEKNDCSCQIEERKSEERTLAVITSSSDIKPAISFLTTEFNVSPENNFLWGINLNLHFFSLPSREPPLYLLNSSLLI